MKTSPRAATIANESPFGEARQKMKKVEDELGGADAMNALLHEVGQLLEKHGRELVVDDGMAIH